MDDKRVALMAESTADIMVAWRVDMMVVMMAAKRAD